MLPETSTYTGLSTTELTELAKQTLQKANMSSGEERDHLLLKSAQIFHYNHDFNNASKTVSLIPASSPLHIQAQLLAARIALAQNNPEKAIHLMPALSALTPSQQLQAKSLLADINAASGYALKAIKARVELEPLLETSAAKLDNDRQIWRILSAMPTSTLNQTTTDDKRIQAWLELARIMRGFTTKGQTNVSNVEDAVLNWETHYPEQPINHEFVSNLMNDYIATTEKVKKIAILLPQQGKFADAARTIKNGLLSAYYADNHSPSRPVLQFYDTADDTVAFSALLQRAISEGATNVIGPLNKNLINKLLLQHNLPVPVLALNYSENDQQQAENLFQFGLAPEDEARQVAELAIKQGKHKAVILRPDNEWGNRLQTVFSQTFTSLGGTIINTQDYATSSADYSRPIRRLFNLDQSARRHRRIENLLGRSLKFTPYRRQDVDMIFMAATYRAARGIMPALKFYRAGNLPVYATSSVYTGSIDVNRDADLNGLVFCDMPWVLENTSSGGLLTKNRQTLKQIFKRNWPDQQAYTRLFALGIDAYHLIFNLEYLHDNDFARFPGATGNLQLGPFNRIIRTLLWAKFINGKAVYIKPTIKLDITPALHSTATPSTRIAPEHGMTAIKQPVL